MVYVLAAPGAPLAVLMLTGDAAYTDVMAIRKAVLTVYGASPGVCREVPHEPDAPSKPPASN